MKESIKNLDGLAIISIDMDIWSGQTKLEDVDLDLANDYNADVVNIGNKRLISRDALKPFDRIKSATRRQLLRRGIPFLSGYAVPVEQLDDVVEEVESLKKDFDDARAEFLSAYHAHIEGWVAQNPMDEKIIRRGTLPVEAVEKRFQFVWDAFHVQSVDNDTAVGRLEATAGQLGDKLVNSIQETARAFWDRNLRGRTMVGTSCQATLREMKRKLESLAFLDSRCKPLIALLDRVIAQSERAESRTGRNYVDPFFSQLVASILILADTKRMNEYLDGYEEELAKAEAAPADAVQDELFETIPAPTTEPKPAPAPAATQAEATDGMDFFDALAEIAGIGDEVPTHQPAAHEAEATPAEPEPAEVAETQEQPVIKEAPQITLEQDEGEPETTQAEDFGFGIEGVSGW